MIELSSVIQDSRFLPRPAAGATVPVGIVLAALAVLWVVKKIILLAVIAAIIAAAVFAYQAGVFDRYVHHDQTTVQPQ